MIVPDGRLPDVGRCVHGALPTRQASPQPTTDAPVMVLTSSQAKGLEFDSVLVVDPDGIVAKSIHGLNDLYVALTRTTRRLGVLHTGPARYLEQLRARASGCG